MTARRTVLLSAAIVAALGLTACHKDGNNTPTADPKAVAAAQADISAPAWLRQHLPAQTVSYVRIPSPWVMLGGVPTGARSTLRCPPRHTWTWLRNCARASPGTRCSPT